MNKFKCKKCNSEFDIKSSFVNHIQSHKKRNIKCDKCGDLYKDGKSIKMHIVNCKINNCKYCGKITKNPKFCDSSCAATYNNVGRIRTIESRNKTGESVRKYINKNLTFEDLSNRVQRGWSNSPHRVLQRICKVCNKKITQNNKYDFCREHWMLSDEFQKAIGHNRNYKKGYVFNKWTDTYEYLLSSLEFKYYEYLTENNIKWKKPKPLKYELCGKSRLYFPDFYLTDNDDYIEIKGYMWKGDKEKMEAVANCNSDKNIIMLSKYKLEKLIEK